MSENANSQKGKTSALEKPDERQVTFSASPGFLERLTRLKSSLLFTSYQSNALYLVGQNGQGGLNIHQSGLQKPMGLAPSPDGGFVLCSEIGIERFENGLAANERVNELFDACFVPRLVHVTGALDAHDVGLKADGTPVFVNTRYNCLAVPSTRHSFEVLWKPAFISRIVDEDRCHLNGLAMRDGAPGFVTTVSKSDTIDGWRDRRSDGGIIIDVATNEVICEGLSMPHSPRWHMGKLWVLNSGTGELGYVKTSGALNERFTPVAFCPGFVRGLAFRGQHAFVGLSKPRYERFEGLALDDRLAQKDTDPWCGVQVIDINTGDCLDWFRVDGAVAELYDIALIENTKTPMAIGSRDPETRGFITFS